MSMFRVVTLSHSKKYNGCQLLFGMRAIFIIMVNDTLVRQEAMVLKCFLLTYYKNNRGRNYRKQGQMLTLVEYTMLLYRALLTTPLSLHVITLECTLPLSSSHGRINREPN